MAQLGGRLLARAASALFGERWQREAARVLRVNERTIRRWREGSAPIPDGVRGELRDFGEQRLEEISEAVVSLEEADRD